MTKRSIQSLGAQEVDVTVIPADLFRQDLSNPADPILDFQDRAIRARRLESPNILATADTLNTHINATTGIHGATSTDTPNTLVTRDNNGGTTLRALQLKRPDGTTYLDATGGLVKLLDRDGFNFGTPGYRTVKTYAQLDAKPAMILLAPVYTVTLLLKTGFMGTVYRSRGCEIGLDISEKYDVICVTAYNEAKLVCTGSNPDVRIVQTTYNNTNYYALYFPPIAENRITLDGLFWGDPIEISDATGYPVTEVTYNLGPYSIVETGSNTNGTWIKFSDGTMIQLQTVKTSIAPSQGPSGAIVYAYDFAKYFLSGSTPCCSVSAAEDTAFVGGAKYSVYSASASYSRWACAVASNFNSTLHLLLTMIAIGRWKQ